MSRPSRPEIQCTVATSTGKDRGRSIRRCLHPSGAGEAQGGDIPADVRTRTIQTMIDNYFRPGTVIQAGYPLEMRYAGPREALLHALIRQNFGCSHLIVGRDHAGVGDYYGPFDAHRIFDQLWDGALQTKPLKIDVTFFCRKCYGMATAKTCPTIRSITFRFPARSSVKCSLPMRTFRPNSVVRKSWPSCRNITRVCGRQAWLGRHDHRANLRYPYRVGFTRCRSANTGFRATIADINALDPAPDVIVHTGDIVHNGRQRRIHSGNRHARKARAPVYVLPATRTTGEFARGLLGMRISFADSEFVDYAVERLSGQADCGGYPQLRRQQGGLLPERARHLIDMIDAEPSKPIAVFAHHPPFEVPVGPEPQFRNTGDVASCVKPCNTPGGSSPASAAMFTVPLRVMSGTSRRQWCRASRRHCAKVSIRRNEDRPVYHVHRFDPVWGFVTESRIVGTEPSFEIPAAAVAARQHA